MRQEIQRQVLRFEGDGSSQAGTGDSGLRCRAVHRMEEGKAANAGVVGGQFSLELQTQGSQSRVKIDHSVLGTSTEFCPCFHFVILSHYNLQSANILRVSESAADPALLSVPFLSLCVEVHTDTADQLPNQRQLNGLQMSRENAFIFSPSLLSYLIIHCYFFGTQLYNRYNCMDPNFTRFEILPKTKPKQTLTPNSKLLGFLFYIPLIIAVPSLCSTVIILLTLPVSTWKGFCKESHSCTPSPSVPDPGFSSLQSYESSALTG
ncbi:hypothetical protein MJG53_018898 [Ovis ammon polii x Ovis aries]|uniref:Uncharacterized protein n=1 Tax=Ovis ammon polii x Ovis aries TaxID=2918886 RepID=A0ACB9U3C4_9CETA|nr:hypothetical protein MJG53_018898 [Ovis ammon polii x Ovis aries]